MIPKLVVALATTALQVGLQALQHTKGPRPDELTVTTADYGTPLTRFLGARKFSCPIIWAKDLEVVEHTTKAKTGAKQTSYGTLATFGLAIADVDHLAPIDKVLKIWLDKKLAYDATGTGPRSLASVAGVNLDTVMRIHTGAEDQLPDPAYVDYCEAKYGPNSAPAFRGIGTLVFDKLPCENFGNRVPNVEVLAVTASTASFPYEQLATDIYSTSGGLAFAPGGQWMVNYTGNNGQMEWRDVATRTRVGESGSAGFGSASRPGLAADGTAYCVGVKLNDPFLGTNFFLGSASPLGAWGLTRFDGGGGVLFDSTRVLESAVLRSILTSYSGTTGYVDGAAHVDHAQSGRDFCIDEGGGIWGLFQPDGSSDEFTIETLDGTESHTFTGSVTRSGIGQARICRAFGRFVVLTDGYFYFIDDSFTVVSSVVTDCATTAMTTQNNPDAASVWSVDPGPWSEYSLKDGSLIRTVEANDWVSGVTRQHAMYDPTTHAIWFQNGFSGTRSLYPCYLDRAANAGVTLGDIVDVLCADAGLAERDTSTLTQAVAGYSWSRSTPKAVMEPLLDIHDVDARSHDFSIQFVPRGSAPSGLVLTQDFASGGKGSSRYKAAIKQDTDLPKIVRVNFADVDHDQQPNNVLAPLPADAVDSQRDDAIDLSTYADTPDGAQQKADRYIRRAWNSRETIDNALTAQALALEPGDVTQLSLDGIVHTVRLDKQTFAAGASTECTFIRDETGLAALNGASGPPMDARDPDVIVIPAPVRGFVIDAPYRSDSDADVRPLLFAGAGAYGQLGFPGAVLYEATGAGADLAYDHLTDNFTAGATWGTCTGTLSDVASPWLWDRGNTLNVTLQNGALTSATEAAIDADPSLNLLLVGAQGRWEYVQFVTATLETDGTYTLSGFKRGRRGTEWACGLHQAGDAWVVANALTVESMGSDDLADSLSFKVQSAGRMLDSAPAIAVDPYTAATLKPWAPARIEWATDGTDMIGTIVRRTRVGGSWVGGSTIPLSENSESYEVDIYNGATFKRTISVSGTNTFTYTGAQISADGNTVGIAPPYNAYQLSDAVGRGFALAA